MPIEGFLVTCEKYLRVVPLDAMGNSAIPLGLARTWLTETSHLAKKQHDPSRGGFAIPEIGAQSNCDTSRPGISSSFLAAFQHSDGKRLAQAPADTEALARLDCCRGQNPGMASFAQLCNLTNEEPEHF